MPIDLQPAPPSGPQRCGLCPCDLTSTPGGAWICIACDTATPPRPPRSSERGPSTAPKGDTR